MPSSRKRVSSDEFAALGLSDASLAALAALGYEEPTPVQRETIPLLLAGLDLLVQACVEKKREDRPQRITDLLEALDELVQANPWTQEDARRCWERAL